MTQGKASAVGASDNPQERAVGAARGSSLATAQPDDVVTGRCSGAVLGRLATARLASAAAAGRMHGPSLSRGPPSTSHHPEAARFGWPAQARWQDNALGYRVRVTSRPMGPIAGCPRLGEDAREKAGGLGVLATLNGRFLKSGPSYDSFDDRAKPRMSPESQLFMDFAIECHAIANRSDRVHKPFAPQYLTGRHGEE